MNATTNVITIDSSVVFPGAGLANIVEDTSPQLGGTLDVNGFVITGYALLASPTFTGTVTAAAVTATLAISPSPTVYWRV